MRQRIAPRTSAVTVRRGVGRNLHRKFVRGIIFFFAVDIGNIVPFKIFAADRIDSRCGNFLIIAVQSAAGIGVLRKIVRCFCAGFYVAATAALSPVVRCIISKYFTAFTRSVYAGRRNRAHLSLRVSAVKAGKTHDCGRLSKNFGKVFTNPFS